MEWLWFWCWLCYLLTVQPHFGLNKWGLQQVLLYPALSVGCSHASLPGVGQSCQEVSSLSLSFLSDFMTRCFLCMRTRPSRWWTLCLPLLSSNVCSLAGGMWCIVWRPLRTSEVMGGGGGGEIWETLLTPDSMQGERFCLVTMRSNRVGRNCWGSQAFKVYRVGPLADRLMILD